MKKQLLYSILLILFGVNFSQATVLNEITNVEISLNLAETCVPPSNLTAQNIKVTTATLSWSNSSGALGYELELISGFAEATGVPTHFSPINTFNATNLSPNANYKFYVRATCGNGNYSSWVGPFVLHTFPFGATCSDPIVISSLPFQTSDSTGNYTNDLAGPQSSYCFLGEINYQEGNDVFYTYTAIENGPVSFTLNSPDPRSAIFIYQNCASLTSECLAAAGNPFTFKRVITYNVTAGSSYVILISSSIQTPIVNYNLLIQTENCSAILTDATVNSVTSSSANFAWNAPTETPLNYQIALQPQGSAVPTGPGQYTFPATNPTFDLFENIEPGTAYQYWVRSECESGIYSSWVGPVAFSTQLCPDADQCTYTFRMTDSANNGWNGARMQIRQNGTVVATIGSTYTFGSGPVDVAVPLCKNVPFDIFWNVPGTQPQQCIVSVVTSFGQTIATVNGSTQTVGTAIYNGLVNCDTPVCNVAPTIINVSPITSTGGTINWNAPATENVGFDIYIALAGSAAPSSTSTPSYSGVNGSSTPFTFDIPTSSNLLADTLYDVYVRVQCEPTNSPWSNVRTFKTLATCPKPFDQMVTNITTNSAVLSWAEFGSATQWEVLLLAAPNAIVPNAPAIAPIVTENDIYIQNISGATTTAVTLVPTTIYYYYVRAVCQPGNDASTWTGPFIFNTLTCDSADKCTYKFFLTNSASNNWNGARMQVRQNGIVIATLGSGGVNNTIGITVAICNNVPFDLFWSQEGTMPAPMGLKIINPFGGLVYYKLPGEGVPLTVLFNSVGQCTNTCPLPENLSAENVSGTSAQLGWVENGSATQWEVYLSTNQSMPILDSAIITGNPAYTLVDANSNLLLNNLVPSTNYSFYVRAVCSSSEFSAWSLEGKFTTKPLNDQCAAALSIPVNSNPSFTQTVVGNTLGGTASAETSNCPGDENDDVWFSFTATNELHLIKLLDIVSTTTTLRFSVYEGTDCATQTQIFCSATNSTTGFLNNMNIGANYKIRVYTNGSTITQSASFRIGIATPPAMTNDECDTAILIPVTTTGSIINTSTYGNVAGATASSVDGTICAGVEDDDVWFKFVATSTRQIISVQSLEAGTNILSYAAYSGNCNSLSLLACAPLTNASLQSMSFVIGQTYYVRVWSQSDVPQNAAFTIAVKEVSTCENAEQFCGATADNPYIFKNTTGIPASLALGCLYTTPNPTYYTLKVSQSGPLLFQMMQNSSFDLQGNPNGNNMDVDFVAWGPFTSPESCADIAMVSCGDCPNNSVNPNFYPLGNIVDCSYSASYMENLSIPNAIAGEYYIVLITNYNGGSGFIKLVQTNAGAVNAGETACADKIQLVAFVDSNNNGLKDPTEANFTNGSFTYQKNNTGSVNYLSNPLGAQSIYDENPSNTYDFNYEINSEYAAYYGETPTNYNDINIAVGSGTQTLYFPITVTQTYSDVDVAIISQAPPRPGFENTQKIIYRNLGSLPTSGTITYTKSNGDVTISQILPAATTATSTGFTYNFTNLLPGEIRFINVKLMVPTIPVVNLGDVFSSTVLITSVENDINTNNNSFVKNEIVVAAYDPNDKNEARGATIQINQFDQEDYLFYTIRFQNTGTSSADTVRIEDDLTSEFNFASVRVVSASHNYSMERINNKLIWTFKNINLPGAFQDEVLSQGYVTFKIKLNPGFEVGDSIENTAEIYFDFNPPIVTNTFQTTFTPNLSIGSFDVNNVVLYPNPAKEMVTIQLKNSSETLQKITIYDLIGKQIKTVSGNGTQQSTINIGELSNGVYMIEIITDNNLKQIRKFIVN